MKTLSALDIHYLIKELQFLVNAKITKIYFPRKKEIILQLFVSGKGKYSLRIDEHSIYLHDYKPLAEVPSELCMFFRKKLGNARLRKIQSLGFERIVSLDFETKVGMVSLVTELFSKGNIILLKDHTILVASEYQNWKDRTIRPKGEYTYPAKDYNFLALKISDFIKLVSSTNKENIVKCLAIELGLGGVYAEESCLVAGIDKKKKAKDLTTDEIQKLFSALEGLKEREIDPRIVYKNKEVFDLVPFALKLYTSFKQKKAKSYNEIVNDYFSQGDLLKQKEKYFQKTRQVELIIKRQREDIKKLEKQEKENDEKGKLLYTHYQLVSGVLTELKDISEKHSWKEIKEKLKGHKLIKEVHGADKSVVVEIK